MKPLATLLTLAVAFSCLSPSAHADRKSREEEKAQQQRLERQLRDVEYILKHESDGTLSDRKAALKAMISTGVAPDEAYWQAGYIKRGDEWVSVQDRWLTPEQEQQLEEYNKARSNTIDTDEGHYKLAQWCAENGFDAQAYGHLKAVLLNNPDHAGLRQMLGYEKIGGRWMNAEEFQAAVREADRLATELQEWGPKVAAICEGLHSAYPREQAIARKNLKEITDVAAVPAMELIMMWSSDIGAASAVEQLYAIDHRRSSIALCKAAMFLPESGSATKQAAIEELKTRPLEDFVPVLLGKMQTPLTAKYELYWQGGWQYSHGPFHMRHYYHVWKESQRFALTISNETMYDARKLALHILSYDLSMHLDMVQNSWHTGDLRPAMNRWYSMRDNLSVAGLRWLRNYSEGTKSHSMEIFFDAAWTARLKPDDLMPEDPGEYEDRYVERIDKLGWVNRQMHAQNEIIRQSNARVTEFLGRMTDQSRYESPEYWWDWWNHRIEVDTGDKQNRVIDEVLEVGEVIHVPVSCFTAGTPVWTDRGPRPIEQLRVGDMVLTQDVETGELMYRPIIRTTTRKPKPLVTIDLGAEQITSTGGHPFFVSGEGWVRARELKGGQILHTPTGTIKIDSVTETPEDETFNLVIDGFHTYFVGMSQVLVHDVSITSPTDAIVPGLLNR